MQNDRGACEPLSLQGKRSNFSLLGNIGHSHTRTDSIRGATSSSSLVAPWCGLYSWCRILLENEIPIKVFAFFSHGRYTMIGPWKFFRVIWRLFLAISGTWLVLGLLWAFLPFPSGDDGANYATPYASKVLLSGKTLRRVYW